MPVELSVLRDLLSQCRELEERKIADQEQGLRARVLAGARWGAERVFGAEAADAFGEWRLIEVMEMSADCRAYVELAPGVTLDFVQPLDDESRFEMVATCGACQHMRTAVVMNLATLAEALDEGRVEL
jgi:hypothetical protein